MKIWQTIAMGCVIGILIQHYIWLGQVQQRIDKLIILDKTEIAPKVEHDLSNWLVYEDKGYLHLYDDSRNYLGAIPVIQIINSNNKAISIDTQKYNEELIAEFLKEHPTGHCYRDGKCFAYEKGYEI